MTGKKYRSTEAAKLNAERRDAVKRQSKRVGEGRRAHPQPRGSQEEARKRR